MDDIDVLIIGAGAAGIAAARKLHDAGQRVLILEARQRIGGRIWTDYTFAGFPLELGAEFIHGELALTHALVRAARLTTLPAPRYPRLRWSEGGPAIPLAQLSPRTRQTIELLFSQLGALPNTLNPSEDCSLADYLRQLGHDAQALAVADVLLAQTCCASIKTLSCADLVHEMTVDHAGRDEFHLNEGYAALLAWYSRGLPIHFNTPVEAVQWDGGGVVAQGAGRQYRARRCLITLPVSLLQSGAIRFDPPLSRIKQEAIYTLRMEPATKLIYRFRRQLWDDDLVYMAHAGQIARWWTPTYGRDAAGQSHAVITAFVTAERARLIDAMPEAAALALGMQELGPLLGIADPAAECLVARRVSWANEPFTRGGYAHIPPGGAAARLALAQPEADRLFFAGEATAYETNPQTVHGAIESGWRAAQECGATLEIAGSRSVSAPSASC